MREQVFYDLTGRLVVDLDRLVPAPCPAFPDRCTSDLATQCGDRHRLTVRRSVVPPQPHHSPRPAKQPWRVVRPLDGLHGVLCQVWQLAIAGDDLRQISVIAAVGTERLTELVHEFRAE